MHIRGLLAPHSMRNNVGPACHSIWIQCGTEWIVLFAKPIQYGKMSDMEQIQCITTEWVSTAEWVTQLEYPKT